MCIIVFREARDLYLNESNELQFRSKKTTHLIVEPIFPFRELPFKH